jgi:hypothetical protein
METQGKRIIDDLLYPELCYKIVGVLFDVYNSLGNGHQEKVYQRAVAGGAEGEGAGG